VSSVSDVTHSLSQFMLIRLVLLQLLSVLPCKSQTQIVLWWDLELIMLAFSLRQN